MATPAGPPLISQWYGEVLVTSAAGTRDILIIGSLTDSPSPDVIPRCDFEPTEQDRRRLANQGVHVDSYDDLSVIKARVARDVGSNLVGEEVSALGREFTREHVLKRLAAVMNNCKADGVAIYYFGNGKRNTGDWCFQDGFVTFRDIADLYLQYFRGRVLTIATDCSHSGSWVRAGMEFLNEQGVQPCGHSAAKKGIFLKVFASCKSYELAATPCYMLKGVWNDKNSSAIRFDNMELRPTQHSCGYDFTYFRCKAEKPEDTCTFSPDYTWHKRSQSQRVRLVRGKDNGRPAWYYVLLVDDDKTIDQFVELFHGEMAGHGNVDLEDFGQVLKSGFGQDPPESVKKWINENY